MARYVYYCKQCNRNYEVDKPMADASRAESCPDCRTTGERVFTAPGISIKGAPIPCRDLNDNKSGGCSGGCCDGHCSL